jgi:hypothetical protein
MSGQRVAQSKKRSVSDFCSSFGLDISLVSLFFCIIGRAQTYTFSFLFFSFPNAAAFDAFDEKMRDPIVAFVDDSFWVGSLTLIPIILLFTFMITSVCAKEMHHHPQQGCRGTADDDGGDGCARRFGQHGKRPLYHLRWRRGFSFVPVDEEKSEAGRSVGCELPFD